MTAASVSKYVLPLSLICFFGRKQWSSILAKVRMQARLSMPLMGGRSTESRRHRDTLTTVLTTRPFSQKIHVPPLGSVRRKCCTTLKWRRWGPGRDQAPTDPTTIEYSSSCHGPLFPRPESAVISTRTCLKELESTTKNSIRSEAIACMGSSQEARDEFMILQMGQVSANTQLTN